MINAEQAMPQFGSETTRRQMFVLHDGSNGVRLKWIERPDEKLLILYTENSASYRPETVKVAAINALRILGQVVWWGHTERG
jgi:phage repressor protein C with HTH and peptisase S24 domain|tara:strand:- start:1041 stop:1286 length:246 start_codon:yes stop_codon:yes gene_type:complete